MQGFVLPNRQWSVEEIRYNLRTDLEFLAWAVVALYRRQTEDERQSGTTRHLNGRGFNCDDAPTGTRLGHLLQRGMRLSDLPDYLAWARRRLPYYSRQITRIANGED